MQAIHPRNPVVVRFRATTALVLLPLLLAAGCSATPSDPTAQAGFAHDDDPAESVNRTIFDANQIADHYVIRPVAQAYRDHLPTPVQNGVHNFIGNLGQPAVAANDLLEGNVGRAGTATLRFAVNSTAGVAGVLDPATNWGLPRHNADFGQTLGVWGVAPGPFVVLPLLGPSNVRDSVGTAAGMLADPFGSVTGVAALAIIGYARTGLGAVDLRAGLIDASDSLEATSLDYYATRRSLYAQQREAAIADGKNPPPAPAASTADRPPVSR